MALLPLAGWAQTVTFGEVGLGKYTYGGTTLPVPVVKDSEGAILTEGTHYIYESSECYKDKGCTDALGFSTDTGKAAMKADGTTKYYIKITGINAYVGQVATPYFMVDKAELTFTLKDNKLDRTYGEAPVALNDDATVDFNFDGFKFNQVWDDIKKGSKPTYSTANVNAEDNKVITFAGGWTPDNYTITYSGKLNIAKKDISTTATIAAEQGDVVYTGKNITGVYTVKDGETTLVAGTDYTVETVKDVTANFKPTISFQGNYKGSIKAATGFAVTAAPITVSVKDVKVTYNNSDQADQSSNGALEFEYSGIVGDDVASAATIKSGFTPPTSVKAAGTATNAGDYTLTIDGGSASGNYEFKTYLPGKLTIERKEVTVTAADKSKKLGAADPEFTFTAAGLIGSDEVSGVTFTRVSGESVGTYAITPDVSAAKVKNGSTDLTSNYKLVPVAGTLTIEKGGIVVAIKDAEKFYGQEDPTFEYVVYGLEDGDELASFTINRDKKGTPAGENVGSYELTATVANPDPAKYETLTVTSGILSINKAQLSFTIPAQNIDQGKDKNALKKDAITVTGINNSDAAATLYELDFNTGVSLNDDNKTTTDETVADGIKATLTAAAGANYEIVDEEGTVITAATGKLIVGAGTSATLNFTSVDADYATIVAHAGETQKVTLTVAPRMGRELPVGTKHDWAAQTWNTMVLPFEVSVADLSQALGYAIVNRVNAEKTTENNVQFKLEMDKIPANEPFCVKTAKAITDTYTIKFPNPVTIVAPADEYPSVEAGMGYTFVGAYKALTVDKNHPTYEFLRGDNIKWAQISKPESTESWTVVPFDAYINLTAEAAARGVTFTFEEIDGSTTTVKSIEASIESNNVKAGWYTLDGVKLNNAPTQKGIYIQNGKKVVVK